MNFFISLVNNKALMTAVISWATAQIVKTLIDLAINRKLDLERLVGSGGMPSCHSATVCGFATICAIEYGAESFQFAIAAILAIIVMYDARGVRRETGNQAEVLNQIMEWFNDPTNPDKQIEFTQDKLKELVGHTPLQVFFGALLGIIVAVIISYVLA